MKKPQEILYGIHPIIELLKAKRRKIYALYTTNPSPKALEQIRPLLSKEVQINYVHRDILTKMAGTPDHQSVVALAGSFVIRSKFFDPAKQPFLILLDSIQDPRNLGAILRSSYCTGITGVVLCNKNSAPLNAVALKSSAGLAEHLEIYIASSAFQAAQELKTAGYTLYTATLNGTDATKLLYTAPLCIVIGNEGQGVSPAVIKLGTEVKLPQRTTDISYNASVAAGILLFLVGDQLGKIS